MEGESNWVLISAKDGSDGSDGSSSSGSSSIINALISKEQRHAGKSNTAFFSAIFLSGLLLESPSSLG